MKYKRLGEMLVDAKVISEAQLEQALVLQKQTKERLGQYLVNNGYITEEQLIQVLRLQLGIDMIDLNKATIDPSLIQYVPKSLAKQHRVVPVKLDKGTLYLAMEDPMNFVAIEDVKIASNKRVVPLIAYHRAIDRALNVLYENEGAHKAIEEMKESKGLGTIEEKAMSILDSDEANAAPTVKLVNSILERGISEGASDIHVETEKNRIVVRLRVDGILNEILTIPKELQAAVISRFKVMGNMNLAERRIPQDGRAEVSLQNGKKVDLRLSTLPTIFGEKVVIRILNRDSEVLNWKSIGISDEDHVKYDRLLKYKSGMILIVGPTGSGKTSTLYTMINELKDPSLNMISLEDPVEFQMEGVTQVAIHEKVGLTFASALRACLRQDPDIICVGEIRDGETAEIAMRAAMTGHLVLSTIHTEDAFTAIDRLIDLGVEPYLIAGSVRGIISQRLVRKVCPNCRTTYQPSMDHLDLAGLRNIQAHSFYRGKGCHMCFDTGFRGRIGIFEILMVDQKMRKLIMKGVDTMELRNQIDMKSFTPMIENGRRLVLQGVTTVEELVREVVIVE